MAVQIKRQTRFAPLPKQTPACRGLVTSNLPEAGEPAAGWGGAGGGLEVARRHDTARVPRIQGKGEPRGDRSRPVVDAAKLSPLSSPRERPELVRETLSRLPWK